MGALRLPVDQGFAGLIAHEDRYDSELHDGQRRVANDVRTFRRRHTVCSSLGRGNRPFGRRRANQSLKTTVVVQLMITQETTGRLRARAHENERASRRPKVPRQRASHHPPVHGHLHPIRISFHRRLVELRVVQSVLFVCCTRFRNRMSVWLQSVDTIYLTLRRITTLRLFAGASQRNAAVVLARLREIFV
jgi:hypothetical protein